MQLPQHCRCENKHHFPYTIVSTPHERKKLHESEYNSHESELVPTTNLILTQRQEAVDSQLLSSKYSYYKTHKNKPSANRLVTSDYSVFVVAYGHFVIVV